VGCGGVEPLTPRKAVARRSEVGRGPLRFAFAHAGRSLKTSEYIANLYSQAEAGRRSREEARGGESNTAGALGRCHAEVGTDF
jgi:hypothetical protein